MGKYNILAHRAHYGTPILGSAADAARRQSKRRVAVIKPLPIGTGIAKKLWKPIGLGAKKDNGPEKNGAAQSDTNGGNCGREKGLG
ncbi:hypothetical protein VTK56DRAFT_4891 [Thermocarpiscus australiensis]